MIEGKGRAVVDGVETQIQTGDVVRLPVGCKHTLIADTDMNVIEVQMGMDITQSDKKVYWDE